MDALIEQLTHTYHNRVTHFRVFEQALQVYAGVEDADEHYDWHGRKRNADPAHPFVVFQYTLDGWGYYEDAHGRERITAGSLFTAIVPSDHRYYRPRASQRWLILWLVVHHPYIVQRIAARQRKTEPFAPIEPGHPLLLRMIELFGGNCAGHTYDSVTHEQSLFALLWEYERMVLRAQSTPSQREHLLNDVREQVVAELQRPLDVNEIAERHGLSRSYFSSYFRSVAGVSPAQYVQRVRLEEAAKRLLHSSLTIQQIAQETGFATATHFCRVFRSRFHLSPGEFRRQLR
jgi:AraC-like DNA-binding protein